MKIYVFILLLVSCTTTRTVTPLTNQQLTDSVNKHSKEISAIIREFVFLDTMFFKKLPDGTVTFRDSIIFNIGVFRKVYVGVREDSNVKQVDDYPFIF